MDGQAADTSARITRLEENLYFLEEQVKSLDSQVQTQQAEMEALAKKLERAQALLTEMRELLLAGPAGKPSDPVPPHHIAKFW